MVRRDELTSRVRMTDITPGNPVTLTVAQCVTRPDGKSRTITQTVPILDRCLARRALDEIGMGDEIDATIVTEWSKDGYETYLLDFSIVPKTNSRDRASQAQPAPAG